MHIILTCDITETLHGKRVVVTGASKGSGEQMAYHYASLGARILITARGEDKLKQVGCANRMVMELVHL